MPGLQTALAQPMCSPLRSQQAIPTDSKDTESKPRAASRQRGAGALEYIFIQAYHLTKLV